jgi:hypothetical protein
LAANDLFGCQDGSDVGDVFPQTLLSKIITLPFGAQLRLATTWTRPLLDFEKFSSGKFPTHHLEKTCHPLQYSGDFAG